MRLHPSRFVVRSYIEHKDESNLRLHAVAHAIGFLALLTALSQVPVPARVPVLGANLGAWFLALSLAYWSSVDLLAAACVGGLGVAWALLPVSPWGPGHGWFEGIAAPLVVLAGVEVTTHFSHVYHHEFAPFLKGGSPWEAAASRAHALAWGPFQFGLCALLGYGWRPKLRRELDDLEGAALRRRRHVPWVNWARLAACDAEYACTPRTVDELVEAVREARAEGQRVRVVASGFSWSSLVPSSETLIFCERLDAIRVDASDPAHPFVWAEAGVTNRQLNRALERHGLCVPWNVVLETVRVAGLVSVGTHGSGRRSSTMGDLVEALEIVDSEGKLRVLSEETVGPEVMSAARLGLGLFGVIARVRLRVVPMFRVRQSDERHPVRAVLERLPELVAAHDSVELYWFPFNRDLWMRTVDRTLAPRTFQGHGFWFKALNFVQNAWLVIFAKLVMNLAPRLTPALLRVGINMLPYRTRVLNQPESQHYHHWIEMMRCGCLEVGFKADADGANVRRAWEATERLVDAYARRGLYPLNLTLNVRFIGSSVALLTPSFGEGITCYVEIMWKDRPKGWQEFSSELCREWLKVPGALPHWAKEFEHVEGIVPIIRENLGERRGRFLGALSRSGVDPDGVFWNPLLRRALVDELPAA